MVWVFFRCLSPLFDVWPPWGQGCCLVCFSLYILSAWYGAGSRWIVEWMDGQRLCKLRAQNQFLHPQSQFPVRPRFLVCMKRHCFFLSSTNWKREICSRYLYELLKSPYDVIQIRKLSVSSQKSHSRPWKPLTWYAINPNPRGLEQAVLNHFKSSSLFVFPLSDSATPKVISQELQCNLLAVMKGRVVSHDDIIYSKGQRIATWREHEKIS